MNTTMDSASWRQQMVDTLAAEDDLSDATLAAMRKVERHLFTGDVPLEHAYDHVEAVITRRDVNGVATSSASAPSMVAAMLDQLDVRPGNRVLEIGAGTGYNAALLSELVGSGGSVTTIDVDDDIVAGARANLETAGISEVDVFCGDGEFGYAAAAPYDRIIVTAGAWDIPTAWAQQLAPDGLLAVPLRIRGVTRSVAFERRSQAWMSTSQFECGFMPVRGAGGMPERNIMLGDALVVRFDDDHDSNAEALTAAIENEGFTLWTGIESTTGAVENLDFFLAELDGFCRVLEMPARNNAGLAEPVYPWGSRGVAAEGTVAYVTKRRSSNYTAWELGACAYGPSAKKLAGLIAERIDAWGEARANLTDIGIEAHPPGQGDTTVSLLVVEKGHTRIILRAR